MRRREGGGKLRENGGHKIGRELRGEVHFEAFHIPVVQSYLSFLSVFFAVVQAEIQAVKVCVWR